ncbi:MAG: 3-methyl-2-oxobutanoate hydroxymethyltransferase [Phycisphaerae bacterium]|nr:3-methyl-2-oxobutanoate hydroxymethyltransferase [Phycisphaerae bacterium]
MNNKITLTTLKNLKKNNRRFATLTCYDHATAVIMHQAGIESILVGDSLAQVMLGHPTTRQATMDIMIALTAAVRRGAPMAWLVGDMPFLSYQVSPQQAITNAGRFMAEAGCDIVKIEVDHRHLALVKTLTTAGIPIMAHLGYMPQSAGQSDKIVQTRDQTKAQQLVKDAMAMIDAGVSSILLECVTDTTARAIAERTDLPVVSCGSGPNCDSQVLVLHELLNLPGATGAKFNKTYAPIGEQMKSAFEAYARDIHNKEFPDQNHCYHMPPEEQAAFEQWLQSIDPINRTP